ncbi:hypothetical protein M413DRAFT_443052 [Hebeloma cylindrosporum]|uniref:Uncharacterized protein n=1 Tax=Hebeloma cylindrosporum TaxID=76867 RepID=A0A0C3CIL1_HEBCY|nr:hypothetical protein M413DRAFT_443052 [Hebeloma cylindrosporum h7]
MTYRKAILFQSPDSLQNSSYNILHYKALTDPVGMLRRRLFSYASDPWEGETLALKMALIDAIENWDTFTEGGPPCPVVSDPEDVHETRQLDEAQSRADKTLETCQNMIRCALDGWMPVERFEEVMVRSNKLKEATLEAAAESELRSRSIGPWTIWMKKNTCKLCK